jgi:metal-responsive CopG/Arc/MetJ family transcriptional regulator
MAATKKIAISLPKALAQQVESLRRVSGESRSAFIRRALELSLKRREQQQLVARYLEGYRRQPETPKEIAGALASATKLLAGEPWE